MDFETKDSGKRQDYDSGMRRDTQDDKPNFFLITPKLIPYEEQCLTRWAALMTRGYTKYGYRNWELANSEIELERFKSSAFRHMMQWLAGKRDEDHMAAVMFNLQCAEYVQWRIDNGQTDNTELQQARELFSPEPFAKKEDPWEGVTLFEPGVDSVPCECDECSVPAERDYDECKQIRQAWYAHPAPAISSFGLDYDEWVTHDEEEGIYEQIMAIYDYPEEAMDVEE